MSKRMTYEEIIEQYREFVEYYDQLPQEVKDYAFLESLPDHMKNYCKLCNKRIKWDDRVHTDSKGHRTYFCKPCTMTPAYYNSSYNY